MPTHNEGDRQRIIAHLADAAGTIRALAAGLRQSARAIRCRNEYELFRRDRWYERAAEIEQVAEDAARRSTEIQQRLAAILGTERLPESADDLLTC